MTSLDKLYDSLAHSRPGAGQPALLTRAEHLCLTQIPIHPDLSNEALHRLFCAEPHLETVPVVEDARPLGLVNRHIFMEQYARPYGREVYGKKSSLAFMYKNPLTVEADTPIETLVKAAVTDGGRALRDGFIVTRGGEYLGLGTGFSLLRAMSDLEAEKTRQLLSSIHYASLIQRSHLAESDRVLQSQLPGHGLLWEPRDVVGGDAYFFRDTPQGLVGCVFDCTGHGVPGAFMTLIVLSFLEQAVTVDSTQALDPGAVLGRMNRYIKRVLQQSGVQDGGDAKASNDGLDACLFILAPDRRSARCASAKLSLMVVHRAGGEVQTSDGQKAGIGYTDTPEDQVWTTRDLDLPLGSLVVIVTDGVTDQIGGPKAIAHGRRRLAAFMDQHRQCDGLEFARRFHEALTDWQGAQRRRDDVTLLVFCNPLE